MEKTRGSDEETDFQHESAASQIKEQELWKSAPTFPTMCDAPGRSRMNHSPSEKPQDRSTRVSSAAVDSDGKSFTSASLKGVEGEFGGFLLGEDYNAVVNVPALQREVQIEGQVDCFALNGERKLPIRSGAQCDRIRDCACRHNANQSSGQPNRGQFQHRTFSFRAL